MKIPWLAAALILISVCSEPGYAGSLAPETPAVKAALPHGRSAGTYQRSSLERLFLGAPHAVDSLKVIVFRVSFADKNFGAQHDSVYYENELRHLREYYLGASRNIFHLTTVLAPGIVALSKAESYYGNDDLWKERMAELLIELVQKTDSKIDFSRYDAYAVIHADAGQETDFNDDSKYQIWSGFVDPREMAEALKDTLGTPGVPTNDTVNGDTLFITNLMIWPEEGSQDGQMFGSLGIYAYQLGLRLGMVTLYDTTPVGFPDSQGIGKFDLMGWGIYNGAFKAKDGKILFSLVPAFPSAFNRYLMGWVTPVVVDRDCTARVIDINSAGSADTALIKIPISPSEYFLIENRVHDANFNGKFDFIEGNHDSIDYVGNGIPENEDTLRGAEFDFFLTETTDLLVRNDSLRITGSGLMIYHVDENAIRRAIEAGGNPNDDKNWKGVDVEEADGIQDLDSPSGDFAYGSYYDSFRKGNNDRFGTDTNPSSLDNSGAKTGIELDEISAAGHAMTMRVRFSPPMDLRRSEFAGDARGQSPIPADINGDGAEELVIAADTGLIYIAPNAGSRSWAGEVTKIVDMKGVLWSGPPILADIDNNGVPEIIITSKDGSVYAFEPTGAPYPIDDDGSPGSLKLRGERASAPIALELDSDPGTEVLVLSSTSDPALHSDSTFMCVLGLSGAPPSTNWVRKGLDGIETCFAQYDLASTPVFGALKQGERHYDGIYFAGNYRQRGPVFLFYSIREGGGVLTDPQLIESFSVDLPKTGDFAVPAVADVDRDGGDEMVAIAPNNRIYYFPVLPRTPVVARGAHTSPPALADIDGDGTIETALRTDSYLYLFTGFGTPVSGWPKRLDDLTIERESGMPLAAPVIGDVNGDGRSEVVFKVAGDLHAFDYYGREIEGWPLAGEGATGGSPALLKGSGGDLYVFDAASLLPYSTEGSPGGKAKDAVSSLRRYDPHCAYSGYQTWPCYRRDAGGSSRQSASSVTSPRETRVDPSTFIVYPNPAMGHEVTVRLLISAPAEVTVRMLNIEGEKVYERKRTHQWFVGSAVPFEETIGTSNFASGVYIVRLEVAGTGWSWSGSKKFAVVR